MEIRGDNNAILTNLSESVVDIRYQTRLGLALRTLHSKKWLPICDLRLTFSPGKKEPEN